MLPRLHPRYKGGVLLVNYGSEKNGGLPRECSALPALRKLCVADYACRPRWKARPDLHRHKALIKCDPEYKTGCAPLHHAPKKLVRTARVARAGHCWRQFLKLLCLLFHHVRSWRRRESHSEGCRVLSAPRLLFRVNHTAKKLWSQRWAPPPHALAGTSF